MGRSATLLLCAIAGLSAVACPGSGSGDLVVNAAPRWASGQVVRYSGAEVNKAGQVIRDIAVTLDVQRDGSGLLTFQGLTVPMVLSPRGDLSVTDPDEPEFIYELPLIAVLPPEAILADGRPLVAGMTWSVSRPTERRPMVTDRGRGALIWINPARDAALDSLGGGCLQSRR